MGFNIHIPHPVGPVVQVLLPPLGYSSTLRTEENQSFHNIINMYPYFTLNITLSLINSLYWSFILSRSENETC